MLTGTLSTSNCCACAEQAKFGAPKPHDTLAHALIEHALARALQHTHTHTTHIHTHAHAHAHTHQGCHPSSVHASRSSGPGSSTRGPYAPPPNQDQLNPLVQDAAVFKRLTVRALLTNSADGLRCVCVRAA